MGQPRHHHKVEGSAQVVHSSAPDPARRGPVKEGTYGGGAGVGGEEHLMSRASPGPHMSEVGASPSQIASTTSVLPSKQTANRVVRKAVRRGKRGSEIELLHSAACTHWASNGMTFKGTRARIM